MINDEFRIEYQFIAGFLVPIKYPIEKVIPMNREAFVAETLAYYEACLVTEKERFGVIGISQSFIEHHSHIIYSDEVGAGSMWAEISKQSGLHLCVDGRYGDPQGVFAILSKEAIPRPGQYHMLWEIISELKNDDLSLVEKIEALVYYDGPYKVEVPEDLFNEA